MIKTILIDDHELVRAGVESLFRRSDKIELIGSFASINDAMPTMANADVLVVDAILGEIDATAELFGTEPWFSPSNAVVVTGQGDAQFISRVDQLGVSGLVSKASDPSALVDAVLAAHESILYRCPEVVRLLASTSNADTPFVIALKALSQRERQIIDRSAAGQRPTDIATDLGLSVKTVNTYRYRAYQKLSCTNDVELARLFLENQVPFG